MSEPGFWERGLSSHDIAPVSRDDRVLGGWRSTALFLACGSAAGWYSVSSLAISAWGILGFVGGFSGFALLMGQLAARMTRSSASKGVGVVGLLRSAFGPRGATPVLVLWPMVLALWVADQATTTAHWLERLLQSQMSVHEVWLLRRLPFDGPSILNAGITVLLVVVLVGVGMGGLARIGRAVAVGLVLWGASGLPLSVLALLSTPIFSLPWWGNVEGGAIGSADAFIVLAWIPLIIPALLSMPDWCRFQHGRGARLSRSAVFAFPFALLLSVLLGALLSMAAKATLGKSMLHPIADTAAFGGVRAAVVGVVFTLGLWLLAPPLIGLYSQAQGWAAAWPRVFSYRSGVLISTLSIFFGVLLQWYTKVFPAVVLNFSDLPLFLFPVMGIVACDELLLRRHRLKTSELYRSKSHYAGALGVTWSALFCLSVGMAFHPWVFAWWSSNRYLDVQWLRTGVPLVLRPWLEHPTALVFMASVGCALLYMVLAPTERVVVRLLGRGLKEGVVKLQRYRQERKRAKEKPRFLPISDDDVYSSTNPNFEYPED